MISDTVRLILEKKDDSRNYYYANLCLRWKNNKIVVSAKEDLHYMVRKFNPKDYTSFDMLCLAIEDEYCIPICYGFGFTYEKIS